MPSPCSFFTFRSLGRFTAALCSVGLFEASCPVPVWARPAHVASGATAPSSEDSLKTVVHHRLKAGETRADVARRYGIDESRLTLLPASRLRTEPTHDTVSPWPSASNSSSPLPPNYDVTDSSATRAVDVFVVPCPPQGWPQVQVQPHQTLWRLCKLYACSMEEVREANHLQSDTLEVGQALWLPGATLPQATAPVFAPPRVPAAGAGLVSQPFAPAAQPQASAPLPTLADPGTQGALPKWLPVQLPDKTRGWVLSSLALVPAREPQGPQKVVELALQFVGTPYVWGGSTPNGADCSGFVQEVFRLAGLPLARTADLQFAETRRVEAAERKPGDLVFFSTYEPGPSHVGIYLGDGRFVHASSSKGVTCSSLSEAYYSSRFLEAHRITAWGGNSGVVSQTSSDKGSR